MYLSLMKVFFKENLSLKRILGTNVKTSKIKAILISIAIIYGFGVILLGFGYLFFDFGKVLNELESIDTLLDFIFIYSTFLTMFFVLFRANGYLFNYKDFDLLQPLPIKTSSIIWAKLTVMMTFIYITVFLIISPIAFSYFYHGGFDFIKLIILIIGMLVIPFLPLSIFSFVSLLIYRFARYFKYGRALNIILMFIFFLGIMYLSMSINFGDTNPLLGQMGFLGSLTENFIFASWFNQAIHEANFLKLLAVIAFNITLLIGFVYIVEKMVIKTNQLSTSKVKSNNKKEVVSKKQNIVISIFKKEIKKFFSVTIYVFNSGFGPVMLAIGGIAILIFKEDILGFLNIFAAEGIVLPVEAMILVVLGFIISTVFTSAISLSLEGKNFWILKSLPIKAEQVMFGKMLFNVILTLPLSIFALFMAGIALNFSFINILVMMLYIIVFILLSSSLGSIINLHFPKFNYVNETEVVKQSLGALLGMFGSFTIIIINGVIYYYLNSYLNFTILVLINLLLNTILFIGTYFYIKKRSQPIFNKL